MVDLPYTTRIILVLGFLLSASLLELALRGRRATRWRSSLALIGCGALGAVAGALVDLLTSALGPAYFAVGKGLGEGAGLTLRALGLGARAGVAAGVVAGAVLLRAAGRPLWAGEVLRAARGVARGAAAGLAVGLAVGAVVPTDVVGAAGFELRVESRRGFALAWAAHAGVYAGALGALGVRARRLRRRRRTSVSG